MKKDISIELGNSTKNLITTYSASEFKKDTLYRKVKDTDPDDLVNVYMRIDESALRRWEVLWLNIKNGQMGFFGSQQTGSMEFVPLEPTVTVKIRLTNN